MRLEALDSPPMSSKVFEATKKWLDEAEIAYRHLHHEPTRTSEESARVRGEDIRVGGKALLIKIDTVFHLFVLSASLKFEASAARRRFGAKKVRFATADELREMTGLEPGSVPPFGRPILPFDLFVDESILANEKIAFNAGSLTESIIISVQDYLHVAQPEVFCFAARS